MSENFAADLKMELTLVCNCSSATETTLLF